MLPRYHGAICIFGKYMQNNLPLMLSRIYYPLDNLQQVRYIKKHWNPKYRRERKEKFVKVDLPNFDKNESEFTPDQARSKLKEFGVIPQKMWSERPAYISCTPSIFETYVAPEGDGRFSTISTKGAAQRFEFIQKKSKSYLAIKKIRAFDTEFSNAFFVEEALHIYIKAHEALAAKDEDALIEYVSESAYPTITHNILNRTLKWKFLESLEPARIVHARYTDIISKENIFAQVTVRFHTQQILAIYDRFGRLLQGSEILKKDVLEYIVFEKHLANEYGRWRIHGKIIPDWMPPSEVGTKTYIQPESTEESPSSDATSEIVSQTVDVKDVKETPTDFR